MPKRAANFLVLAFLVAAGAGFFPPTAQAGLEWKIIKDMDVKASPLEVASSADGKRLFILTPGEVLVYSAPEDSITERIPIGREFDRIALLTQPDRLVISSSAKKTLQVILLETVYKIDATGLPSKGPENAPVTVAVFTDYQ